MLHSIPLDTLCNLDQKKINPSNLCDWIGFSHLATLYPDTQMLLLFFNFLKVLKPFNCPSRVCLCRRVRPNRSQRKLTWRWIILLPILVILPVRVVSGILIVHDCSRYLFEMRGLDSVQFQTLKSLMLPLPSLCRACSNPVIGWAQNTCPFTFNIFGCLRNPISLTFIFF